MAAQRLATDPVAIMVRQPSGPGIQWDCTVQGQWTGAVLHDFHECTGSDPEELEVWFYTDRLSYAPGGRVGVNVDTTTPHCDLEIVRRVEGIAGPNKDEFSTRMNMHRPWSRGFVRRPKGVLRITRNVLDRCLTEGVDCG